MRKIHYKIHYTEDSSQYTLLKTQSTFQPGLLVRSESHRGLETQISALWSVPPRAPLYLNLRVSSTRLRWAWAVGAALGGAGSLSLRRKQRHLESRRKRVNGQGLRQSMTECWRPADTQPTVLSLPPPPATLAFASLAWPTAQSAGRWVPRGCLGPRAGSLATRQAAPGPCRSAQHHTASPPLSPDQQFPEPG